jgi:hypothetical protein
MVAGVVVDSVSRQPIEYASVAAYRTVDSIMVTGSVSNIKGEFTIRELEAGNYYLRVNFVGYTTATVPVNLVKGSVRLENPVELTTLSLNLGEVQILGKQNEKQVSIEKTKINVSQSMSGVTGNITDVLKNQSNILIDAEDNVYLRGSSKVLLLIDGRPTTISSLNAIPSASVENIEIVTNPDVKYDAEGTGGIINIITKRNAMKGLTGSGTLNYGMFSRVNGGIGISYGRENWDIAFNYSGKYENTDIQSNLERDVYSRQLRVEQDILAKQVTPGQSLNFLFSARPGHIGVLTAGLKFMMNNRRIDQRIRGWQKSESTDTVWLNRLNLIAWNRTSLEGNVSYRWLFDKNKHEFTLDAFYSQTKGSRPADYYINDVYLQKSEAGGRPTNFSLQADHMKSLFKRGKLESGLKFFSRWNTFNSTFYDLDTVSGNWVMNPDFSNDLEHRENITSGYLMYSDSLAREMYYRIGARLEYSTSEMTQKTTGDSIRNRQLILFPYLLYKYTITNGHSIAFGLNRRVTRPAYGQLNPFVIVVDQSTFETGNKYLQPEILDKAEVNYSVTGKGWQFRNNLYVSLARDFLTQVTLLSEDGDLIITWANGSLQTKAGIDMDAVVRCGKILTMTPGFSAFYTVSEGYYQGVSLNSEGFSWTGNMKFTVKPIANTEVQLFLNYNSPVTLPQFRLQEIYYADVSVKRTFFNNTLTAGLTVTDLFNTRNWAVSYDNQGYDLYNYSKYETRIVWIGLSYNLNSFKPVKSQKNEPAETDNGLIRLGE